MLTLGKNHFCLTLRVKSSLPLGASANIPRSSKPIQNVASHKQASVVVANPIDQKSSYNNAMVPTSQASSDDGIHKSLPNQEKEDKFKSSAFNNKWEKIMIE